jgi:hypothetical protein
MVPPRTTAVLQRPTRCQVSICCLLFKCIFVPDPLFGTFMLFATPGPVLGMSGVLTTDVSLQDLLWQTMTLCPSLLVMPALKPDHVHQVCKPLTVCQVCAVRAD